MTIRERAAAGLLLFGLVAVLVAAYAYDGWRAVAAVAGAVALLAGVLLGLDDRNDWKIIDVADLPDGGTR